MKRAVPLLSCLLLVAAAAHARAETGGPIGVEAAVEAPVMLAAAGGHDSVGGLLPLPLWPPYRPRVVQPASSQPWRHPGKWRHAGKKCAAPC